MLIASITTLGVWSSGNASVILGVMPDSIILQLADMDMDAALDELVIRVSRVPNPMTPSQINRATKMGLAHQANLLVGFDPRWGEVLYLACAQNQMSDEQISAYLLAGIQIDMLMRDRVHQGADKLDCFMEISPGRFEALTGGQVGYTVQAKWVADGIVGEPTRKYSESGAIAAQVRAPSGGWWSTGAPYPIHPTGAGFDQPIGTKVRAYLQYDFIIEYVGDRYGNAGAIGLREDEPSDGKIILDRITVEQDVEIIDPAEPIVETIEDPKIAKLAAESLSMSSIRVKKTLPEPEYQNFLIPLSISRESRSLPESISLRVYIRLKNGQEVEIGSWVNQDPSGGQHGSGLMWRVNPKEKGQEELERIQEIIDELIEAGKADLILRTDPDLARGNPRIKQVIGFSMIIEDVAVKVVEDQTSIYSSQSGDWFKGKVLNE